jgi:hypothetical protein
MKDKAPSLYRPLCLSHAKQQNHQICLIVVGNGFGDLDPNRWTDIGGIKWRIKIFKFYRAAQFIELREFGLDQVKIKGDIGTIALALDHSDSATRVNDQNLFALVGHLPRVLQKQAKSIFSEGIGDADHQTTSQDCW